MQSLIEVFHKNNYDDKKIASIKTRLQAAGLKNIGQIIPSALYQITGDYTKEQIQAMGAKLFADPVLQTYQTALQKPKGFYKVQVWIRDSSSDVVGESVQGAIAAMGYHKPVSVRVANVFAIKGGFTKAQLEEAVKKTFVNEVLNKFIIEEF